VQSLLKDETARSLPPPAKQESDEKKSLKKQPSSRNGKRVEASGNLLPSIIAQKLEKIGKPERTAFWDAVRREKDAPRELPVAVGRGGKSRR